MGLLIIPIHLKRRVILKDNFMYDMNYIDYERFMLKYNKVPEDCRNRKEFKSKCKDKYNITEHIEKEIKQKKSLRDYLRL